MRWVVVVAAVLLVLVTGWVAVNTLAGEAEPDDGEVAVVTVPAAEERGAAGLVPPPVAQTRAQLLAAAEAGDHDLLARLAVEDFSYTFGAPAEGGPAEYWRELEEQGERPLAALATILRLPYALSGGIFVWPFAHAADPGEVTEYERGLLEEIPGGAQITAEGYLGWRTGIAPDGEWRFFIAGD